MPTTAFLHIDDWQCAQTLANRLSPDELHRILDRYAQQCCPVLDVFAPYYHWSFMQVEYATDLVFRSPAILKPLYEQLSRQALTVKAEHIATKAEHVATFLGHKITAQLAQEIGSQFATRIEGTCVNHRFGKSSIKILRQMRPRPAPGDHHQPCRRFQALPHGGTSPGLPGNPRPRPPSERPSTASRTCVRSCSIATTAISNTSPVGTTSRPHSGARPAHPAAPRQRPRRPWPELFQPRRTHLLAALQRPGFNIANLRRADLLPLAAQCSPATLSRQLGRRRHLGVIKRVTGTYRDYLTRAGRAAIAAARRLSELTIIPALT